MEFSREQQFIITGSALTVAAIGVAVALSWTSSVMVPFVLSILVSYLVGPLVDVLQVRLRAPRWAALLFAMLVITAGSTLFVLLVWTSLKGLVANFDLYGERITQLGRTGQDLLERLPAAWVPPEWTSDELDVEQVLAYLDIAPLLGTLGNTAGGLLQTLSLLVGNGVLVTLFSVYLIAGRKPGITRTGVRGEIDRQIQRYLVTKSLTSFATGLGTWVILALMGLDLALVFGVLAFLLNFIPSVGSMVAMLLPIPIALMQFDSVLAMVAVVALPGALQFTIGNILEPKMMGEGLDMHPITVLTTLIFWGLLWGPVGMLLATPMTSVMKIAMSRFETTRPIAELLAGRLAFGEGD